MPMSDPSFLRASAGISHSMPATARPRVRSLVMVVVCLSLALCVPQV